MKVTLLLFLLTSLLSSAVVETNEGTFLQIFADKDPQSNIVASVSTSKGKIAKKRCFNTRDNSMWCKVVYSSNGVNINGFSDKNK